MTEAEKYFKVKLGLQFGKSTLNIIQSFADEQVKKELTKFLQWFLDNESTIEGDPEIKDFVELYLTKKP